MSNPPAGVRIVMEAMCYMKKVKPEKVKDPEGGTKKINDFWAPSKKLILGDSKLLKTLQDYDKDNIAPDIIKKIRKLKENPEFALDRLKTVSKAAHGLACWVYAMESYDRVAKVVGLRKKRSPKRKQNMQWSKRVSTRHKQSSKR